MVRLPEIDRFRPSCLHGSGLASRYLVASHCAVLTAGPARIAEYFPIDLPFPRALPIKTTDEFGAYARRIYASLGLSAG